MKFSAAVGYSQLTDEGCLAFGNSGCTDIPLLGGGGTPFQGFRHDVGNFQIGASIMHVPSGLLLYAMYEDEQNNGTQYKTINSNTGTIVNSNGNGDNTWFLKVGIRRTWMPMGATVIWGEWGQYNDMFTGLCGNPGGSVQGNTLCQRLIPTGTNADGTAILTNALIIGSEVDRWGIGVVQEMASAAMHLFVRWQHMDLDLDAKNFALSSPNFGKN